MAASMGRAAIDLAGLGWSVVPAATPVISEGGVVSCSCRRPGCPSPGKHPRIPWAAYQRQAAAREQLTAWWAQWPDANISVVTGRVSGLLVVDVDPLHGGDESLADLPELPNTPRVLTGSGGLHVYLAHPGGADIPSRAGVWPGIDIRADGGQVIAPPSLHVSGRRYEWEADADPWAVPLAPAPQWLLDAVMGGTGAAERPRLDLETLLTTPIPEGERNSRMTQIVGALVRLHPGDPWRVAEEARAVNQRLCRPPLPDAEVGAIVRSIWRRDVVTREAVALAEAVAPAVAPVAPALDAEAGQMRTPEERSVLLTELWGRLGLSVGVERLVAYETPDGVEWWLVLADGREVPLGENLLSQAAVQAAILNRVGVLLATVSRRDWAPLMAQAAALSERVQALPPGPEQLAGWIEMLMQDYEPVDADEAGADAGYDALRRGHPVIATVSGERHLWVSLGRLSAWLEVRLGLRVPPRRLATWARQAGWEPATYHAGGSGWRVWRRPWRG